MTTFALVAGAIPVAFGIHVIGTGQGGEFRRGLATVLIGGLLTSMFLTLFVVPVAYSLLESLTARFRRTPADAETPSVASGLPGRIATRNDETTSH